MSKWINKDLFNEFQKEKIEEKESPAVNFVRSELIWPNPEKGTVEVAKVYEGRFLTDSNGKFYEKYFYHMWKSGEKWIFVLCPKTHGFNNYCPFCSAVTKLYSGTKQDKANAYLIKRKERFVGNFYVVRDPRDEDRDEEKKCIGKVKLYEFPSQIEKKLKKEVTDRNEGYGYEIFDPGENGRNFIINVLSTKKDEKGNQWPDYSPSQFSRRQSALGTEQEIDDLMGTCVDIMNYINSMEVEKDKQVEILKSEFLWDLVEEECLNEGYADSGTSSSEPREERRSEEQPREERTENVEEENQVAEEAQDDRQVVDDNVNDIDDDDLLKELDSL